MKDKLVSFRLKAGLLVLASVLFVLSSPLSGRVVMLSEARTAAARLVALENLRPDLRLTQGTFSVGAVRALTSQGLAIGYLVKLSPQGFMILSGVTEADPEVFISFSGDYDSLRGHSFINRIMVCLKETRSQADLSTIRASRAGPGGPENGFAPADMERHERLWNLLLGSHQVLGPYFFGILSEEGLPPLLTCHWKQGSPLNLYTPVISGQHTLVGCTPLAMAAVMYFWKYPDRGQGSDSYTWHGQTLSADFNHPYYWDRMLDSYAGYATADQIDAVARLVSDVGISVHTDYELGGSGASAWPGAFFGYFRYATSAHRVYRWQVADWAAWFDILRQQMDKRQPVVLSAFSATEGHALVVDGYRTAPSDQIHVNLGWGESWDCYTSVESIYGYGSAGEDAVIDIHPGDVTLVLEATGSGTTDPPPGTYKYPWNQHVTVSAYPDPHFELREWLGDAAGSSNPLNLMMDRDKRITASFQRIISAPMNASGQRVLNRSLSQAEYINVLTFEANPDNVDITGYRIYLIEEAQRTQLAAVDANTFKYLHRGVAKDKVYFYWIVAVNSEPREGHPATVVVQ